MSPFDITPINPIPITVDDPYQIDMEVDESQMAFNMSVDEEIDVTVIQGTDVSDTTAVEADVVSGKKFHKANGDLATGSLVLPASAHYNDVNFYDYDGTIVASYSAADFANLSAMPDNPTHTGLTAQGWNWTLADAKAQVAVSGFLDIGQMYVTSDGKTRLYITLSDGRLYPRLYLNQTVGRGVEIDWGDGSATETLSGTETKSAYHLYPSAGDYVITLNVTSGKMLLGGTSTSTAVFSGDPLNYYRSILRKIELGSNAGINTYGLYCMYGVQSISVPTTATSLYSFYYCQSLRYITIPSNAVVDSFRACGSLFTISFPKNATVGTNTFHSCQAVRRVTIPQLTAIPDGMFNTSTAITKLVIPSTVTSIGNSSFYNCTGMKEYHFKPSTPPAVANSNAFTGIPSDCVIYVPSGSLSAYTSASDYPSASSYTYIEE